MTTAELSIMTIGEIAERTGAPTWAVRRTLDAMRLGKRVGPGMRVISGDDLPIVEAELRRRGYIEAHPSRQDEDVVPCGVPTNGGSRRGYHPPTASSGSMAAVPRLTADRRPLEDRQEGSPGEILHRRPSSRPD